jgi:Fe-S cluster assembly scaffold protein SufB
VGRGRIQSFTAGDQPTKPDAPNLNRLVSATTNQYNGEKRGFAIHFDLGLKKVKIDDRDTSPDSYPQTEDKFATGFDDRVFSQPVKLCNFNTLPSSVVS